MTEAYYDAVRLIARLTDALHSATLGGGWGRQHEHWRWMSREPEPGDLVVEQSTAWCDGVDNLTRIGRFLGRDDEWHSRDEVDGFWEPVYVVALADGRVVRWVNCSFARVPEERLGMLTGTAFWFGGTAGEVSGTGKNVRDYCRERYGVELELDGGHTTMRGEPYWRWPQDADGNPVRAGRVVRGEG